VKLEAVKAELRPRGYAEAVDLGFRMGRLWFKPMVASWAITVGPMLILAMATAWRKPWLVLILLWWLKPVVERVPLSILSRVLFGQTPSVRDALRQAPGLFFRRDALLALTMFRFDPFRSARLPIWQLEGNRGRRERTKLLLRGLEGEIIALTFVCYTFELILTATPLLLIVFFVPDTGEGIVETIELSGLAAVPHLWAWTIICFWAAAAAVIQPFYVGAGFSLYLNRRTHLEAWDIEVAFRRMARRLRGVAAVALITLLILPGIAMAGNGDLEPATVEQLKQQDPTDPKIVVRDVLADPEFGGTTTERRWSFDLDFGNDSDATGAFNLGGVLASVLEPLLWIVVVVGLALLIVQIMLRVSRIAPRDSRELEPQLPPQRLFGLDVRKESLPDDIVATARELWSQGKARAAIGLLYRAAVARLVTDEGFSIKESATESECLRLLAPGIEGERLNYFRALTESWQSTAYGHQPPGSETAAHLLDSWDAHFGTAT